jgi:hypothetical protein
MKIENGNAKFENEKNHNGYAAAIPVGLFSLCAQG